MLAKGKEGLTLFIFEDCVKFSERTLKFTKYLLDI